MCRKSLQIPQTLELSGFIFHLILFIKKEKTKFVSYFVQMIFYHQPMGKVRAIYRRRLLIFFSFIILTGEPEVDYPIFATAPDSSFTCDGKDDGMYADVEARCQVKTN